MLRVCDKIKIHFEKYKNRENKIMTRQELIASIEQYQPYNEQEEMDKPLILEWIKNNDNAFLRENVVAHMTASAWVVSPDRKKVLMIYHNIYRSWAWLGGHADGMTDLRAVAEKEVAEECGLTQLNSLCPGIFSLEVLTVDGHEKRGQYVGPHLHLNVTYLFEADPSAPVFIKPDENSGVAWLETDALAAQVSEPWMMERIYRKLMNRVQQEYPNKE